MFSGRNLYYSLACVSFVGNCFPMFLPGLGFFFSCLNRSVLCQRFSRPSTFSELVFIILMQLFSSLVLIPYKFKPMSPQLHDLGSFWVLSLCAAAWKLYLDGKLEQSQESPSLWDSNPALPCFQCLKTFFFFFNVDLFYFIFFS